MTSEKLTEAIALHQKGQIADAVVIYDQILRDDPDNHQALHFRGLVHFQLGEGLDAIRLIKKAISLNSSADHNYYSHLGASLAMMGHLTEAIESYQKALEQAPNSGPVHNNLGNAYQLAGRIAEALVHYKKSLEIAPLSSCHSNAVFSMNFLDNISNDVLARAHLEWANVFARPHYPKTYDFQNPPVVDRKLRIGFMSADFRLHSVAYFFEPVLDALDRSQFEVVCFAEVIRPDDVTARFRQKANGWVSTVGLSDEQVVEQIRKERIDILVDLAGHTNNNHLVILAYKPAPIQVSWLGYANTTGMETVDYRITDAWADPPGTSEPYYSENLWRLPGGFLCFHPPHNNLDLAPCAPCVRNNTVTFGSFNNLSKMSPSVVETWATILHQVPRSRLLLKGMSLQDAKMKASVEERFAAHGIQSEQLYLSPHAPMRDEHLSLYNQVDIALDTFPYNGTTTTCEALWMGVPVVTFNGDRHAARVGTSLMHQLGLEEMVAQDREGYVALAVSLANDPNCLNMFRRTLRQIMKESKLCNEAKFANELGQAFRSMWTQWCAEQSVKGRTVQGASTLDYRVRRTLAQFGY